eukprot:6212452-Pleurochrysis_carterae.AAC.2
MLAQQAQAGGKEAAATAAAATAANMNEEALNMNEEALKQQRAAASAKGSAMTVSAKKVTDLEVDITNLCCMLNHAYAAARAANKENATSVTELEAELQRAKEGRIWARVREKELKRVRAKEASRVLQEQVDAQQQQLSARSSQKVATERQELSNLRFWCKAYEKKVAGNHVKSNRKFFDVKPLADETTSSRTRSRSCRAKSPS